MRLLDPVTASALGALALVVLATPSIAEEAENKWAKHWRERVEAFRQENAALPEGTRSIVFVGDSMTEGFPLATHFPYKPVLNRGISADVIGVTGERGILRRLDESVFDTRCRVVFLMIGVNDLASSSKSPEFFVEGFGRLVDEIRARLPEVRIVVQTCLVTGRKYSRHATLNPRIEAYNRGLRELAKKRELPLVDLEPLYRDSEGFLPDDLTRDGLHLKRDAFATWADAVRPYVP